MGTRALNDQRPAEKGPPGGTPESVLSGSTRAFAADALFPITALVVAALLSRHFGPDGYGLITLAVVVVVWVEWTIAATFSRATVKYVREAADWRTVAATVVRAQFALGVTGAVVLALAADPLAETLGDGRLAVHLRVFALDIPVFVLARAHRDVLVGLGRYRARALAAAVRWIARLVLIVAVVLLGGGTVAVLLAMVAASVGELVVCRLHVRPSLWRGAGFPLAAMAGYLVPIGVHAICLRLFLRADIVLLSSLGGTVGEAGHYGAAQNFALLAPLLGGATGPILLSALTLLRARGDSAAGDALARKTLERSLLIVVVMALVSAVSPGIIEWVYGVEFAPAASVLRFLALGSGVHAAAGFGVVILVAGGAPRLCILVGPVVLTLAVIGHLLFIPAGGPDAAAAVTAGCALIEGAIVLALVWWRHRLAPRASYVLRAGFLGAIGYAGLFWLAPSGVMAPAALAVAGGLLLPAAIALGLVARDDVRGVLGAIIPGGSGRA